MKEFLNLTISMQYCDQPSSFSQAPSACGVQCSTERLVISWLLHILVFSHVLVFALLLNKTYTTVDRQRLGGSDTNRDPGHRLPSCGQ